MPLHKYPDEHSWQPGPAIHYGHRFDALVIVCTCGKVRLIDLTGIDIEDARPPAKPTVEGTTVPSDFGQQIVK